jgi:predicted phage terminase large subunit-like protein
VKPLFTSEQKFAQQTRLAEHSLHFFVQLMWPVLEPATPYTDGWWPRSWCAHLEAVENGDIVRLIGNCPPGATKPVAVDQLVTCRQKGLVPLRDIQVGDEVLTHMGRWGIVREVHEQGVLPVLRMTTQSGAQVWAAADHPFLTPDGWVPIASIGVRDVVGLVPLCLPAGRPGMAQEEARLLGYIVGDGSVTHSAVNITCADDISAADIYACSDKMGFANSTRVSRMAANGYQLRRISLRIAEREGANRQKGWRGAVREWLKRHDLEGKSSYTKRVPVEIMQGDDETVRNFLAAYWACDGYISTRGQKTDGSDRTDMLVGCDSVSKALMSDIKMLLQRLGVSALLRIKRLPKLVTKRQGNGYTSYHLSLRSQDDVWRFANQIKIPHAKRSRLESVKLRRFDFDRPIWGDVVDEVAPDGERECRCLTVDGDHSFVANGFAVHNSLLTNVFFPAWIWGPRSKPSTRILTAAYSQILTERDNDRMRLLIQSPEYQSRWGHVFKCNDSKVLFQNNRTGWKLASSVGGTITGQRGDIFIIDDPNAIRDSDSTVRETTNTWLAETMPTRLNNLDKSAIIVIQQRTHQEDATGFLLRPDRGGNRWTYVMVPMVYDPEWTCGETVIGWTDPRQIPGELFWPARFSPDAVADLKAEMSEYAWAGQMQQRPEPRGGAIIKRDWWKLYGKPDVDPIATKMRFPSFEYLVASLDCALTDKSENDPSACVVLGVWNDPNTGRQQVMVVNAWQARLQLNPLVREVAKTCDKYRVNRLIIENKANGYSVEQEIRRTFQRAEWGVEMVDPHESGMQKWGKIARTNSVTHLFEEGMIWHPNTDWAEMLIDQCAIFPRGSHDDLVDAMIQGLRHLRERGILYRRQEARWHEQDLASMARSQAVPRPLYTT